MDKITRLSNEDRIDKALYYTRMLNLIDLTEPKTTNEIVSELMAYDYRFTPRQFRQAVEDIMYLFMYEKMDKMIVGDSRGYKYTNDSNDLEAFLKKKKSQYIALSRNYWLLKKELCCRIGERLEIDNECN